MLIILPIFVPAKKVLNNILALNYSEISTYCKSSR